MEHPAQPLADRRKEIAAVEIAARLGQYAFGVGIGGFEPLLGLDQRGLGLLLIGDVAGETPYATEPGAAFIHPHCPTAVNAVFPGAIGAEGFEAARNHRVHPALAEVFLNELLGRRVAQRRPQHLGIGHAALQDRGGEDPFILKAHIPIDQPAIGVEQRKAMCEFPGRHAITFSFVEPNGTEKIARIAILVKRNARIDARRADATGPRGR